MLNKETWYPFARLESVNSVIAACQTVTSQDDDAFCMAALNAIWKFDPTEQTYFAPIIDCMSLQHLLQVASQQQSRNAAQLPIKQPTQTGGMRADLFCLMTSASIQAAVFLYSHANYETVLTGCCATTFFFTSAIWANRCGTRISLNPLSWFRSSDSENDVDQSNSTKVKML